MNFEEISHCKHGKLWGIDDCILSLLNSDHYNLWRNMMENRDIIKKTLKVDIQKVKSTGFAWAT